MKEIFVKNIFCHNCWDKKSWLNLVGESYHDILFNKINCDKCGNKDVNNFSIIIDGVEHRTILKSKKNNKKLRLFCDYSTLKEINNEKEFYIFEEVLCLACKRCDYKIGMPGVYEEDVFIENINEKCPECGGDFKFSFKTSKIDNIS